MLYVVDLAPTHPQRCKLTTMINEIKIGQNDNLFNLLVHRSIYDGEHPSLRWVSTSTASLAKVSNDRLHPSKQSTHPWGQVWDEDWMGLTSFRTMSFSSDSNLRRHTWSCRVWFGRELLEKATCSWWKSTLRSCGACSLMWTLLMFLVTMGTQETSVCAWLHVYVCATSATEEFKLYWQSDNESLHSKMWINNVYEGRKFMKEIMWTPAWLIRPEW